MTGICRPASLAVILLLTAMPRHAHCRTIGLQAGSRDDAPVPAGLETLSPLLPPDSIGRVAPQALAMDGLGRLFVLDRSLGRILRLDRGGEWRLFGSGEQGGRRYPNMTDLYAGWGPGLFALDPAASEIHQFDLDGNFRRTLGYSDRRDDRAAGLDIRAEDRTLGFLQPADFALSRSGELLLLDESGGRLLLYDRSGRFVTDLAAGTAGEDRPQAPTRLSLDAMDRIYVLDPPAGRIRPFSRQGAAAPSWPYREGLPGRGSRRTLLAVAGSRVVVASGDGRWVRLFDPAGGLLLHWDNPAPPDGALTDMATSGDTLLYLASPASGQVHRWRWTLSEDTLLRSIGNGPDPGEL